jgi:hypothetical protein
LTRHAASDAIVGSIEPKLANRFAVGEEIREQRAEFEAKILVEQQLSCGGQDTALPIRRVGQARTDVRLGEFGVVTEDFLVRHSGREPAEDICHGNTHMANTRPTATLARL